jgi:hypothetical protein
MTNRVYVLAAALTSCALAGSAYVIRRNSRREKAREHKDELRNWESEGGKPALPAVRTAQAV